MHIYVHSNVFVHLKELFVVRHSQEICVYLTLKETKHCNAAELLIPQLPPTSKFFRLKSHDNDHEINLWGFFLGLKEAIYCPKTASLNQTDSWFAYRSTQIKPSGLHFRQLCSQVSAKGSTDVCEWNACSSPRISLPSAMLCWAVSPASQTPYEQQLQYKETTNHHSSLFSFL